MENMLPLILAWLLIFRFSLPSSSARLAPYALRISCGARKVVQTPPTYALWHKDSGYTGGIPANATLPSVISPPLKTLRYFPEGPNSCYYLVHVPIAHYSVRIFFGIVDLPSFEREPLFDISIEGTQISSLNVGWSTEDDQVFAEALIFLLGGTSTICFHSTGHGVPAILSIEILQVDDDAYNFGQGWGQGVILRTAKRLSFGTVKPRFDVDYSGSLWGGARFWDSMRSLGKNADSPRSTENDIKNASTLPNVYPKGLYQTSLVSTDEQPDLTYSLDVEPDRYYSIWLHFAEIDDTIRVAERVFDVIIDGETLFSDVDIVKMTGDGFTALVLNATVICSGRKLTVILQPKAGHALISAIEVFEVIHAELRTLGGEVSALQNMKKALGIPSGFGWNGDPCIPPQHPWNGINCQMDKKNTSRWFIINGLDLHSQGLRGSLPNNISQLKHIQTINLSGNSIHGEIPALIGSITSLQVLDLSYNSFNGSIPETLGELTSLRILNLNGNSLSGKVPEAVGGRLLHNRASFNFTDNAGLSGIPGPPASGPHLSSGAKIGIAFGVSLTFLLMVACAMICWKRRQNILRAQPIAARGAPHDIQMARHGQNS